MQVLEGKSIRLKGCTTGSVVAGVAFPNATVKNALAIGFIAFGTCKFTSHHLEVRRRCRPADILPKQLLSLVTLRSLKYSLLKLMALQSNFISDSVFLLPDTAAKCE